MSPARQAISGRHDAAPIGIPHRPRAEARAIQPSSARIPHGPPIDTPTPLPRFASNAINAVSPVPALNIRNLDETTRRRLRLRAAEHGHSMEEEIRTILRAAVADDTPATGLGSAIHALFAEQGGVELDLPPRLPGREPPAFD